MKETLMSDNTPKWTPGPWKANSRYTVVLSGNADNRMSGVAEIRTWMGREQQAANANLIAAAPDLYAVVHNMIQYCPFCSVGANCRAPYHAEMRAALAKAEGA
jgi:hypothetical protein